MSAPSLESLLLNPERFVGRIDQEPVGLFLLRNANGMAVAVTNLGAKILQIVVPDRHGIPGDVALGYDSLSAVLKGSPSMGAFIGRYAGRIAHARFKQDGIDHRLMPNAGPHCLHGGPRGSRYRVFEAQQTAAHSLTLRLMFEPRIDHFPGTLALQLRYSLSPDNELVIEHHARAVEGTSAASFASHVFFNLDGPGLHPIDQHHLHIASQHLLHTDAERIATGERLPLNGSPLDWQTSRRLDSCPLAPGNAPIALDHAYEICASANHQTETLCAQLSSTASGRTLQVWSTEPVLQVYTADALGSGPTPDIGKTGVPHRPRHAICLEPQQFPNAPNCPDCFPINWVTPLRPYQGRTRYRFGLLPATLSAST